MEKRRNGERQSYVSNVWREKGEFFWTYLNSDRNPRAKRFPELQSYFLFFLSLLGNFPLIGILFCYVFFFSLFDSLENAGRNHSFCTFIYIHIDIYITPCHLLLSSPISFPHSSPLLQNPNLFGDLPPQNPYRDRPRSKP